MAQTVTSSGVSVYSHAGGSYDQTAQTDIYKTNPLSGPITYLTGSADPIPPHQPGNYVVTTAGVDAMTLAAPTAGIDDGLCILVCSGSANAHTLTATGLLATGAAGTGLLTFAAFSGANCLLRAYNAKWQLISSTGITVTS